MKRRWLWLTVVCTPIILVIVFVIGFKQVPQRILIDVELQDDQFVGVQESKIIFYATEKED